MQPNKSFTFPEESADWPPYNEPDSSDGGDGRLVGAAYKSSVHVEFKSQQRIDTHEKEEG